MEGNELEEINDGISDEQQVLELGIMLGQCRAFGLAAGRLQRGFRSWPFPPFRPPPEIPRSA
jgi:hypothetical protein